MSYEPKKLSALSYANGFTLWYYRTADMTTEVDQPEYFNLARNVLREGDFIFINCAVDDVPSRGAVVVVEASADKVSCSRIMEFGQIKAEGKS